MLEKPIEDYLVECVEAVGGIALKGDIKGRRFIDRICIMPWGITGYAECKRPTGGTRSALQIETINRLHAMGHVAMFVISRKDVDFFMQLMRERRARIR